MVMPSKQEQSFLYPIKEGWHAAIKAIVAMPLLSCSAFLVLYVANIIFEYNASDPGRGKPDYLEYLLGTLIRPTVTFVLLSALIMSVHRFVILNERLDRLTWWVIPPFWRFTCVGALLTSIMIVPFCVEPVLGSALGESRKFIVAALTVGGCLVWTRTILVLPALAVGTPGASFRNAWHDSHGRVGEIFFSVLAGTVPPAAAVSVIVTRLRGIHPRSLEIALVAAFVVTAFNVLASGFAAALVSRFYQKYSVNHETGSTAAPIS
jgi:hypothetical protein